MTFPMLKEDKIEDGLRLTLGYWTPQWRSAMGEFRDIMIRLTWIGLAALSVWLLFTVQPLGSFGQHTVAAGAAIALSYVAAFVLNHALAEAGGGYFRASQGNARLIAEITSKTIRIKKGRSWQSVSRGNHRIFYEPHPNATQEIEEERLGRTPMPAIYRHAFQVGLRDGVHFMPLAEISDKAQAEQFVLVLQDADARVMSAGESVFQPRPLD